jgi:hypothetical protein
VIATRDVESALVRIGVLPDVQINQAAAAEDILFVHRQLDDGDLYFLVNRSNRARELDVRFRVFGKAPDIWRADSAMITPASYRQDEAGTAMPLAIGAEDSLFVLFRRNAQEPELTVVTPELRPVLDLAGHWDVTFQAGRGAPESIELASLGSLSEHPYPGVRYFSGVAKYITQFTLPSGLVPGEPLWLDLGGVGDLAEVSVNGELGGVAWQAPYRVEIGSVVRQGVNTLEIKVANRWINRLIGDAQPGATPITFTTIPTFHPDAPLRPSGLIGPVRLLAASEEGINE